MRLQQMFGPNAVTAVQDPSYPVYVDTAVMLGQTGPSNPTSRQYEHIVYMPCTPENGFFPDYASHPRADVVYLCSPKYVSVHFVAVCWSRFALMVTIVATSVRFARP